MMFRFEKLAVWQKAVDFADHVYRMTRSFPSDERFGLSSQLRRAAVPISSNIAEGSGRSSDTEFSRFIQIAYGSVMEVVSQSHVAQRQQFVSAASLQLTRQQADELARMLRGLRASFAKPNA